jgi:hypothetical protein
MGAGRSDGAIVDVGDDVRSPSLPRLANEDSSRRPLQAGRFLDAFGGAK